MSLYLHTTIVYNTRQIYIFLLTKLGRDEIEKQCLDIRTLMSDGKNDQEIIQALGLTRRSFYRRKNKIFKDDKEIWDQVIFESLEHRALEVKKALEFCIKINKEIAQDHSNAARDRTDATKTLAEAQIALWHLVVDGPRTTQERQVHKIVQSQLINNKDGLKLTKLVPEETNLAKKVGSQPAIQ